MKGSKEDYKEAQSIHAAVIGCSPKHFVLAEHWNRLALRIHVTVTRVACANEIRRCRPSALAFAVELPGDDWDRRRRPTLRLNLPCSRYLPTTAHKIRAVRLGVHNKVLTAIHPQDSDCLCCPNVIRGKFLN